MGKIAVDVVLLPAEKMMLRVIEANRELVQKYGPEIVLNTQDCLPHISLAMGCIETGSLSSIENILKNIASNTFLPQMTVTRVDISTSFSGKTISAFEIEKLQELVTLHEQIMERLESRMTNDATADMLVNPQEVGVCSLQWIRDYRTKSSFEHFFPHITIGYGCYEASDLPPRFSASHLALCRLGNHCTCRKVLASIEL